MAASKDKEEWRTFTAKLRKQEYDFVCAVLQRVGDVHGMMPGTALALVLQDWVLAPEHRRYNPDAQA